MQESRIHSREWRERIERARETCVGGSAGDRDGVAGARSGGRGRWAAKGKLTLQAEYQSNGKSLNVEF